jgi:hypothetical protein
LTISTNITSGLAWDDENFKIPLGFTTDIGGISTSSFIIGLEYGIVTAPATDTAGDINTFIPFGADLEDRNLTPTPISPIRYAVTGSSPDRIFKLEFFNAGFSDERFKFGTNKDSVDFQVWIYETTNIIEFRYGPSKITNPSAYFDGPAPLIGYGKKLNILDFTCEKVYSLSGSPSAPKVDSIVSMSSASTVLSAYPANGTVYRFVPKNIAASIGEIDITQSIKVYPTSASSIVNVDYKFKERGTAEILNLSGQKIHAEYVLTNGLNTINIDNLPSGNYLLKIVNSEGNAVYKFAKD